MINRSGIVVFALLQSAMATAASLPLATGDVSHSACSDAMLLATEMFQSTSPLLYAPPVFLRTFAANWFFPPQDSTSLKEMRSRVPISLKKFRKTPGIFIGAKQSPARDGSS
jgi:hypothetical protein